MGVFRKVGNAFARFMYGRNGMDQLNVALLRVYLGIFIVQMVCSLAKLGVGARICELLLWPLMVLIFFRMFSKKLNKRRAENLKYTTMRYQTAIKWNKWKTHLKQKKDYRFFKCPACTQKVRVPKGHDKIEVTCPKCRERFVRKS